MAERFDPALANPDERARYLAGIIESAMDAIITLDEDFRIVLFNPAAERMFRCRADQALGHPIDRFIPERYRDQHRTHLGHFATTSETNRRMGHLGRISGLRADGTEFLLESSIAQARIGRRKVFTVIHRDASERAAVDRAVAERLEIHDRLTKIASASPGLLYTFRMTADGRVTLPYAGPRVVDLFGISPEALTSDGTPIFERMHPDDLDRVQADIERSRRDLTQWQCVFRIQHPTRGDIWLEGHSNPERASDGSTVWHGFVMDVTTRIHTETALQEQTRRLEQAHRLARIGVWEWDLAADQTLANDRHRELLGLPPGTGGSRYRDFEATVHPEDRERIRRAIDDAITAARPVALDFRVLTPEGESRWLHGYAEVTADPRGAIRVRGTTQDITDRKRAEIRLATQEAVSRVLVEAPSLAEATPLVLEAICRAESWRFGAIWAVDSRRDRLVNVEVWHDLGVAGSPLEQRSRSISFAAGEGLPGRAWANRSPQLIRDLGGDSGFLRRAEAAAAGLDGGVAFPIMSGDEVIGVVDFLGRGIGQTDPALASMLDAIGRQIGGFIHRRRIQEETDRVLAISPAVIYALAVDGPALSLKWMSENLRALVGYADADLASPSWWIEHIHPDDRERVEADTALPYDGDHRLIEYRVRRRDGEFIWVRDERRVVRDPAGQPIEIIGSWSDVTQRVGLEDQLRQSQKLEAIGLLAGGVAHDFNNLLTVINGYSDLVMLSLPEDDGNRPLIGDIRHAGERAAGLTRQLLAFSRKQVLAPRLVDLAVTVSDVEKLLRRLIGENIALTTVVSPTAPAVTVDPGQIEQVIINLAINARDAMPDGGRLTIDLRGVVLDESYCRGQPGSRPGPHARLSMTDTGIGMSFETQSRIFEPFFTTKEAGRGTGLGLATVFGIVKQSDGHIVVASAPGAGSTFSIFLPAAAQSGADPRASGPVGSGRGHETILVVEDEDSVRRIVRIALESSGYRVLEAPNGAAALERLADAEVTIDLLVSDLVMPGMSGRVLADRVRGLRPGLKVLFISGYTDDSVIRHGLGESGSPLLLKPFAPSALVRAVRNVLDGRPERPSRPLASPP